MANQTIYVDNINGSPGNPGTSEAFAVDSIPAAIALITGGGNTIYIQAGSNYVLTSTITVAAGLKGDVTDGRNRLVGYTATPGGDDGRPTITCAANSVVLFTLNDNDYWEFRHLNLTHTAATRGAAFSTTTSASSPLFFTDVVVDGCLTLFNTNLASQSTYFRFCEIKNTTSTSHVFLCSNGGLAYFYGCDIHDNAGDGIRGGSFGTGLIITAIRTIFDNNAVGLHTNTSGSTATTLDLQDCIFVDNTSHGIEIDTTSSAQGVQLSLVGNILCFNGGYGITNANAQASIDALMRINRVNAFDSNTSGPRSGMSAGVGDIYLSADPFTNRASRDFSLNNTPGGGASLRSLAFPLQNVSGTTLNFRDVGPWQHQSASGRGVSASRIFGGF